MKTVEELFDELQPFYFLNYTFLEKILNFFLGQANTVIDDLHDYIPPTVRKFQEVTTVLQFMNSIEQAQQSHSTTSERPGLCTVNIRLVGEWLEKTMDDLEKLVIEIFKEKRYVLSHLKIIRGSVIITFIAPLSEVDSLIKLAMEHSSFITKVGVFEIVVGDTMVIQNELTGSLSRHLLSKLYERMT